MIRSRQQIVIYGAGGFAREVAWLIEACNAHEESFTVTGFIDDNVKTHGTILDDIPVMGLQAAYRRFPAARVVSGIGNPQVRQRTMEKAEAIGFGCASIIHPRTERSRRITIGEGTVICAGCILTTNIQLGKQVQINIDCTIGHDVTMSDYVTLAPGVHVSGLIKFGQRVYIGTGAVIINGTETEPLIIEDDVIIGAGACVTKSVARGETVVGVPAKALQKRVPLAA